MQKVLILSGNDEFAIDAESEINLINGVEVFITSDLRTADRLCRDNRFGVIIFTEVRSADGAQDSGDFTGKLLESGYDAKMILVEDVPASYDDKFHKKTSGKPFWHISIPLDDVTILQYHVASFLT